MSNLYLAGFMGAGKTTTGPIVAKMTGRAFLDLDRLIEYMEGRSIPEIFETRGEAYFRKTEAAAVKRIASLHNSVVALGGGTLEDPGNLRLLRSTGTLILLQVSPEEAVMRAAGYGRPLLEAPGALHRAVELLESRSANYEQAHFTVSTDKTDPETVARTIVKLTGSQRGVLPESDPPIQVNTKSGRYSVLVQPKALHAIGEELLRLGARHQVVIATEPLAFSLHGDALCGSLEQVGLKHALHLLPGTEEAKTLSEAARIYDSLAAWHSDRSTFVITLGGGVVGDTAGFAASTYMRGVPLVHCPTTLLAQVDSAVGGKVAVNHAAGKNLIGSFYQPRLVVADTCALTTLSHHNLAEGLAEVVKGSLLSGEGFLRYLEHQAPLILSRDLESLNKVVSHMVSLKARVVMEDERDLGLRMTLNLGHTLAHAVETATGNKVSHGEAVSMGLVWACRLGERIGLSREGLSSRVKRLLERLDLPTQLPGVAPGMLLDGMKMDKKTIHGTIRVIVPVSPGKVLIREDISHKAMLDAMETLT